MVGVGNPIRGDDAAGSALAARLIGKGKKSVFDAGSAPENYVELIASLSPGVVILVDAVRFGGNPGEVRFLRASDIESDGLSTHDSSLKIAAGYLEERCGSRVFLLGIEPESSGLGSNLSAAVKKALDDIEECLDELIR